MFLAAYSQSHVPCYLSQTSFCLLPVRFQRRGDINDLSHAREPPMRAGLTRGWPTGSGPGKAEFELSIVYRFHSWENSRATGWTSAVQVENIFLNEKQNWISASNDKRSAQ